MVQEVVSAWSSFHATLVGACAALGGLIIVAISVNLEKITASPGLSARAGASIAVLMLGLITQAAALVPGQPLWVIGVETLLFSLIALWISVRTTRSVIREQVEFPGLRGFTSVKIGTYLVPTLGYIFGGSLLVCSLPAGFYVLAASTALAICGGVHFTWIALVEIRR